MRTMCVDFPYGRTQITSAEYAEHVDKRRISQLLASNDVIHTEKRVEMFIDQLPSLLAWLEREGRDYPWRHTKDPWKVYATEILLQRTRGDAVGDIYDSFFTMFPGPEAVIHSSDDELSDEISSLGFGNQRTRSIREAAEHIVENHNGDVPANPEELQRPWRVGKYSARACLLFAFDEPVALVDVNTARIISRVFEYEMPAQPHKSDTVYELLDSLVPSDPQLARAFNFALLDLGALICTEENPTCQACPLSPACAYAQTVSGT